MPKGAPAQVPVKSYPTPNIHSDVVLTETWNTENAGEQWQPLDPGTPHPNTRDYPGFMLARMEAIPGNEKWLRRIWVTDNVNQDLYNYAVKYVAEANGYPIFIRQYQELRATYAPRTKGMALQTVYKILLTAAGSGYTTPPALALTGGAGSGAQAEAVLNQDGTLAEVVLLQGGLSYTSAPAVGFSGGGGSGATASASIQPSGAILVSEEAQNYDPQDPSFNLYVQVMRVYKTLPGPLLTGATQNPNGVAGTITTQDVAYGAGADTGANVEHSTVTPTSSVEGKKETLTGVLFSRTDGLGYDGSRRFNEAFGLPQAVTVKVSDTPEIATGINVVKSLATPMDALRTRIDTSEAPFDSTTVLLEDLGRRGYPAHMSRTWVDPGSSIPDESFSVEIQRQFETKDRAQQDVSNYEDGSPLIKVTFDEFGGLETITDTFVDPSTVPELTGSHAQELIQERQHIARLIDTLSSTAGTHVFEIDLIDERIPGSRATKEYYLVAAGSGIPSDTNQITYSRRRYPKNVTQQIEIKTTYAIPPNFEEYEDRSMAFPTIFNLYTYDSVFGATLIARRSYSRNKPHHIYHTFGLSNTAVTTQIIQEAEWEYYGFSGHGLTDGDTYTKTVGGASVTFSLPTSNPSRTAYNGLIGTEIVVGGESIIYRAGIYWVKTVKVKAE